MRSVRVQVAVQDAYDVILEHEIVVWAADPADVANGEGEFTVCSSGTGSVAFAAHYPNAEATKPEGYLRFDHIPSAFHFLTRDIDWFVVSRVRR